MTQPVLTDPVVRTLFTHCRWYELALRRHGFTPDKLMRLARKVAADGMRRRNAALGDRFDDLVSRLTAVGLEAALRYDPRRTHAYYGRNGGDPFTSYVSDLMDKRIDDFFRSRSEGFADKRYRTYGEVIPTDQMEQQRADVDIQDVVEQLDSLATVGMYRQAADDERLPLHDWIVQTLNRRAAMSVPRPVAIGTTSPMGEVASRADYWPGALVIA